jgi:putative aldouronate transport system permease protein
MRRKEKYPLQLVLREILILSSTESMMTNSDAADIEAIAESIKYATIIVATIPILLVYPFLQRYFVKGALIGAVKG